MSLASAAQHTGSGGGPPSGYGLPGAALRRVLEHIEANVHRDSRLSELIALAHMSAFHFTRLFKRSMGISRIASWWRGVPLALKSC